MHKRLSMCRYGIKILIYPFTRNKRVNETIILSRRKTGFHAIFQVHYSRGLLVLTYVGMACIIMYCQD